MNAVKCLPVVVVVGLVVACGGGGGTPATKPRRSLDVERVSAVDLHREYTADKDAALQRLGGRTLEVTGKVGLVYTDHEQPRLLLVAGDGVYLGCWFHKSRTDQIRKLEFGQEVHVVGVLTGRADAGATLEDCALVK